MKTKQARWLATCALIIYSAILIRFVVFKAIPTIRIGHFRFKFAGPHTGPANLIPFKTIFGQLIGQGNRLIDMVNLMGNLIPFLPIGLLAPLVSQSISWQKALILGVVTGLTFEVMEVIFQVGIFDVDDVMMNALGVVAGYGMFVIFRPRLRPPRSANPSIPYKRPCIRPLRSGSLSKQRKDRYVPAVAAAKMAEIRSAIEASSERESENYDS